VSCPVYIKKEERNGSAELLLSVMVKTVVFLNVRSTTIERDYRRERQFVSNYMKGALVSLDQRGDSFVPSRITVR